LTERGRDSDLTLRGRDSGLTGRDCDLTVLVRDFVGRFLDFHLETRPRSQRAFLDSPNRNAPAAAHQSRTQR
jgi:hypothetical protein